MTQGACLCGAVRYEVSGPYRWMSHCHCSMCRKHHGSLYSTTVGVDHENFRWLQGQNEVIHYRTSETFERPACRHCGSVVPDTVFKFVVCPAGTLDIDLEMKPQAHIFVASRSPMCEITDKLPQFDEYPPGYGTAVPGVSREAGNGDVVRGSCLCGEVAFELDVRPTKVVNCHCSRCRRSRGAPHATNVFTRANNLRWTKGAEKVKNYRVPDAYTFSTAFCQECGGLLPALFDKINAYLVPVGTLDTSLDARPGIHIYVGSKAPWFEITDSLPQFEGMPPRERFVELFF